MPENSGSSDVDPLLQPKIIERLRDRPKLVDAGLREEFWDELANTARERRKPDRIAEEGVRKAFNRSAEAAAPPVRNRVRGKLEKANESVLNNL